MSLLNVRLKAKRHRDIRVYFMSNKSIRKNYIYNLSYQVLVLITPLITAPYISRVLGADGIGTISYAESVVSYFVLFAAVGIPTYGQREISYVQDSVEKRSEVFWNTKILECTTSLTVMALYFIFAILQKERTIYLLFLFNLLSVFADVTWFFQGIEEFGVIVLRNTVLRLANIAYLFIVVRTREDILPYAFGTAFFGFLSSASLWGCLRKYINKINTVCLHPYKDMKTVISLFIPTVAIQVYTVLDKTMIGAITHDACENGYYEQAVKISKMVLTVVTSLGTVMIPRIGYHFKNREADQIKMLMYRGYRFVWFLGIPLCLGIISCAEKFVPWFLGNGYEKVIPLLQILSLLILAIGINNVTGMQYLIPTGRQKLFTFTVIIGAGINFIMNLILIRHFQAVGAAIASVSAETVIAVAQIFFIKRELSALQIIRESYHYIEAGATMACVLWFVSSFLQPSFGSVILLTLIGIVVYLLTLCILRDEFFISNANAVLRKIRK